MESHGCHLAQDACREIRRLRADLDSEEAWVDAQLEALVDAEKTVAGHEAAMRGVDKYLDDLGHPEDDSKGRRTLRARLKEKP